MEVKLADPADTGHPGLCLEQCQICVVSGFGCRLDYCHFNSQIEALFPSRAWLSVFNANLNETEALSLSDESHKSWIKNSWKNAAKKFGWKEGIQISCLPQMNHPCGQKYNHFIMKFHMDSSQNRNPDYMQPFLNPLSTCFFLDDNIRIRLCSSAGEFCAAEILCVHLLVISSFSSAVPLPLITMATSVRRSWLSHKKGWITKMWIFSYIFTLLAAWSSASSQSMKRLSKENRKTHKQNKEKSAHKQPSATSHHLPAAWNTDTVWGAASSRHLRRLPFTTTRYVISLDR